MRSDENNVNTNLIMDAIRLLILITKFEYRKSFKLSIDKVMLYDFIMKFPTTLEDDNGKENKEVDFREYYSYYHWKPNQGEYIKTLNYLISKNLVSRKIEDGKFYYLATNEGKGFIASLNSNHKKRLDRIATYIKSNISKLTDKKVEDKILEKINIVNRFKGDRYD
ncbi:MAG: hypothetical protein FH761_08405 [Firmicutes bacterium]|nr:hypothetical protein [Bacillota bacterium]